MTYEREMAHKAQDRWLNGDGGHSAALEAVEAVVAEVIERCAKEAERESCRAKGCVHEACVVLNAAASDIRALARVTGALPGERR